MLNIAWRAILSASNAASIQRGPASGRRTHLLVAAIILWNTIYPERAFAELRRQGRDVRPELAKHVAPLG
jgi:TnpA family transposase